MKMETDNDFAGCIHTLCCRIVFQKCRVQIDVQGVSRLVSKFQLALKM